MATKKAASEGKLGELHSNVAELLNLVLMNHKSRQEVLAENYARFKEQIEANPDHILTVDDLDSMVDSDNVPDKVINAAITFLKNNDITCVPSETEGMDALQANLEEKRRKRLQVSELQLN